VRPLSRVWGFDGAEPRVPAPAAITAALENVGFDKLEVIDASHVRKAVPALEIDLASIGQGYTVGRLAAILEQLGIADYLVEIGGELMARGQKPGGEPWRIGIEEAGPGHAATVSALALPPDRPTAAVTSGTYRRYFEEGGRAYSHILDPRTGRPVDHALSAVTVLHSDPTLAGAWATALLCLGPERAAAVAERERLAAVLSVETGASLEQRTTTAFRERWDLASRQPRRLPR
jgi:thiamine biosynthesis lipoprotein